MSELAEMLGFKDVLSSNRGNDDIFDSIENLSGGEKQKLSILRAIIKNPELLILDEPTSALDASSHLALKKYLQGIKKDKIIVLITHDLDLLSEDDNRIYLTTLIKG